MSDPIQSNDDFHERISVAERMARMEANLLAVSSKLDKVIVLMDRMVRVEERQTHTQERIAELYRQLEKIEADVLAHSKELELWGTARRFFVWASAIVATIIAIAAAKILVP